MTQKFMALKCLLVQKKVPLTYENSPVNEKTKGSVGCDLLKCLCICFRLPWGCVAAGRLSLAAASWGCSLRERVVFPLRRLLFLPSTGSGVCGLQWLRHIGSIIVVFRLSFSTAWNLPGPGIEPVSPALADRFLSPVPRGKS